MPSEHKDFFLRHGILAVPNCYEKKNYYGASLDGLVERIGIDTRYHILQTQLNGARCETGRFAKLFRNIAVSDMDVVKTFYDTLEDRDYSGRCGGQYNRTAILTVNNLVVVDIDNKNGKDGMKVFREMFMCRGLSIPETLTVTTKSDGRHVWFKRPPSGVNIKPANYDNFYKHGVDIKMRDITAPFSVSYNDDTYGKVYMPVDPDIPIAPLPEFIVRDLLKRQYHDKMKHTVSSRQPWRPLKAEARLTGLSSPRDILKEMFKHFKPDRSADTELWKKTMFAICVICDDDDTLREDMCHEFSRRWEHYNSKEIDAWVKNWKWQPSHDTETSMRIMMRYLKQDVDAGTYKAFEDEYISEGSDDVIPTKERGEMFGFFEPSLDPSLDIRCDKRVNQQYINFEYGEAHKLFIIKGGMGTGKTTAMRKFIHSLPKDARVLIVSARITLDRSIVDELNKHIKDKRLWFKLYSEAIGRDGLIRGDRLVCQVDSVSKIEGTYDVLIIDEPRGVINQLNCMGTKENGFKRSAFEALEQRIKATPYVMLTDAFVDDATVQMFEQIKEMPAYVVINDYMRFKDEPAILHDIECEAEFNLRVMGLLETGLKIACPCALKDTATNLYNDVVKRFPKVRALLITADTHDTKAVSPSKWVDYDIVIYSPTIVYGVSFDEEHFDMVVGYLDNSTVGSVDFVQMLKRVRKSKSTEVYYKHTHARRTLITSEVAYDAYSNNIDKVDKEMVAIHQAGAYDWQTHRPIPDVWYQMHRHERVQRDRDSMMMPQRIAGLLKTQGMDVKIVRSSAGMDKKEVADKTKALKSQLNTKYGHDDNMKEYRENYMQKIAEQPDLDHDDFERLKAMVPDRLSDTERAKIQKFIYTHAYDAPVSVSTYGYGLMKDRNIKLARVQRDISCAAYNNIKPDDLSSVYLGETRRTIHIAEHTLDSSEAYHHYKEVARDMKMRYIGHDISAVLQVDYGQVMSGGYKVKLDVALMEDVIVPALDKHHSQVSAYKRTTYEPEKVKLWLSQARAKPAVSAEDKKLVAKARNHLRNMKRHKQTATSDKCIEQYKLYQDDDGQWCSSIVDASDTVGDDAKLWGYAKKATLQYINSVWASIGITFRKVPREDDTYAVDLINSYKYGMAGVERIPAEKSQYWNLTTTCDMKVSDGISFEEHWLLLGGNPYEDDVCGDEDEEEQAENDL